MDRPDAEPGPRIDGTQLAAALLSAADELRRRLAALSEPHGITPQQYNVLQILGAEHPNPMSTLRIGERLLDRTPGTSRLLERLAAKGLVRRERPASNRRLVHCWITPAGLAVLGRLGPEMARLNGDVARALGEDGELVAVRLAQLTHELRQPDGVVPAAGAAPDV